MEANSSIMEPVSLETENSSRRNSIISVSHEGRKFSRKTCLTSTMAIIAVVGAILLIFGVLALSGHMGEPTKLSSFIHQIHHFNAHIAQGLGTTPLTTSIFSAVVGGALFVGGGGTLLQQTSLCGKRSGMAKTTDDPYAHQN